MKRVLFTFILIAFLPGCDDAAVKTTCQKANVDSGTFVNLMNAGRTTRQQEQDWIRALDSNILQIDAAVRGSQNALLTRQLVQPTPATVVPAAPTAAPTAAPAIPAETAK